MAKTFIAALLIFISLLNSYPVFGETYKTFTTRYTTVYYANEGERDDFLWRIGGEKGEFSRHKEAASNRVDRIVEKVMTVLGMHPKDMHVDVYVARAPKKVDLAAYYEEKNRSIYMTIDRSSENAFAHEIAYAVIDRYFSIPVPEKTVEILAQYVDRHLWTETREGNLTR